MGYFIFSIFFNVAYHPGHILERKNEMNQLLFKKLEFNVFWDTCVITYSRTLVVSRTVLKKNICLMGDSKTLFFSIYDKIISEKKL